MHLRPEPSSKITITNILLRPSRYLTHPGKKSILKILKASLGSDLNYWMDSRLRERYLKDSCPAFNSFAGEARHFGHSAIELDIVRLKKYLHLLMKIVNHYHENENFLNGCIKPESINHLVRFICYESAFYARQPLHPKAFQSLLVDITKYAADCKINLHFVFNFSVLEEKALEKGKKPFFNILVYVECGEKPRIQYFAKQSVHQVDIELYPPFAGVIPTSGKKLRGKEFEVNKESKATIQINFPFFVSFTAGGLELGTLIDSCIDHQACPAQDAFLEFLAKPRPEYIAHLPDQYDHIIISNSWPAPYIPHLITGSIVLADPYFCNVFANMGEVVARVPLKPCEEYIPTTGSKTRIHVDRANRITLTEPPFGPRKAHLAVHKPTTVQSLWGAYKHLVWETNQRLKGSEEKVPNDDDQIIPILILLSQPKHLPYLNKSILFIIASYQSGGFSDTELQIIKNQQQRYICSSRP